MDDDNDAVIETIKKEELDETCIILENVPLYQRKANNFFDQDENHIKTFTVAKEGEERSAWRHL